MIAFSTNDKASGSVRTYCLGRCGKSKPRESDQGVLKSYMCADCIDGKNRDTAAPVQPVK